MAVQPAAILWRNVNPVRDNSFPGKVACPVDQVREVLAIGWAAVLATVRRLARATAPLVEIASGAATFHVVAAETAMPSVAVLGEVPGIIAGLAHAPAAAVALPAWAFAAEELEVAVADGAGSRQVAE